MADSAETQKRTKIIKISTHTSRIGVEPETGPGVLESIGQQLSKAGGKNFRLKILQSQDFSESVQKFLGVLDFFTSLARFLKVWPVFSELG